MSFRLVSDTKFAPFTSFRFKIFCFTISGLTLHSDNPYHRKWIEEKKQHSFSWLSASGITHLERSEFTVPRTVALWIRALQPQLTHREMQCFPNHCPFDLGKSLGRAQTAECVSMLSSRFIVFHSQTKLITTRRFSCRFQMQFSVLRSKGVILIKILFE